MLPLRLLGWRGVVHLGGIGEGWSPLVGACVVGSCTLGWRSTKATTMMLGGPVVVAVVAGGRCVLFGVVGDVVVCIPLFQRVLRGR